MVGLYYPIERWELKIATLHDIARRINSVDSTRKITATMEMVAKTKIYRSARRVARAKPYARFMREMLTNMADRYDEPVPLATPHDETKRAMIIVITSDRGLCGHFNNDAIRLAEMRIRHCQEASIECDLILCGKVAVNYFKYRGFEPIQSFTDLSASPTVEQADGIADYLVRSYLANTIDEVYAIYNHHRGALVQIPVEWKLMPIDMAAFDPHHVDFGLGGISDRDPRLKHMMGRINYEPSREYVLERLLPEYLAGYIYYMLINSAAGEQVARQVAMRSATDNADDILRELRLVYNHVRQDSITTELNEIVGGEEALAETLLQKKGKQR
ncbi:ATP synthase F1 subunit gamma [Anaerotardibacter muris]|uniref:ATP synthase F1 subunit gamma n=1 Tax=Anaerotardibacter muris TaxID=2941505 RepID=UPI0020422D4E|nr:ATP synthase F1 subunit gamma [Anaerotardibacter muris]